MIYTELICGHNLLVRVALLSVLITGLVLFLSRFGLRLRAVGEKPEAVNAAGISVAGIRYRAVMVAGMLCGLARTYLSIAQGSGFLR